MTESTKTTRADWLTVARDILISDGIDQVKVLAIGERLGTSRSSFYWFFKSRADLLDALLEDWRQTNTAGIVRMAERPAPTIAAAVLNVFRCVYDTELFNAKLDFAVRSWARQSGTVRRALDLSEAERLDALTAMFARHGYCGDDAVTRARVLYFMQKGYDDADLKEPDARRMELVPHYVRAFTGTEVTRDELNEFRSFMAGMATKEATT